MTIRKSGISGIPFGNTAARPASPVIGATYYDGTLGFLMIFDGTSFIPCSAPAAQPTIVITDAGSGMAYGTVKASVAFTEGVTGGKAAGFTASQSNTTATSTSSPILLTITGNPGSYSFGGTAYNGFGTSPAAVTVSQTLTSVPDVPTIGTATGGDGQISLTFTAGATGGSAITNYQWSTDNITYTALSPADTTSPVTIPGLTNGTAYTVRLKAVNANGVGLQSGASNSITPNTQFNVEYLVVAGGGGGNRAPSNNAAGGGGAGGYRTNIGSPTLTNPGVYDIVIGAGGSGSNGGIAGKGGDSRYSTIYSTGGGGGSPEGTAGQPGGSGSGSANNTGGAGNQGGYSPVEGYGAGTSSGDGGNGGGGAGGASPNATSQYTNGSGGIGSDSASSWASITSSGASGYFAGGGGGGSYNANNNTGTGGAGGGGDAKSRAGTGGNGQDNTGGGGGGSGGGIGTTGSQGGNGGSGIVILKYPSSKSPTFSGVTQTTYTDGGFKYTKITAGTGTVTF